jgi:hypothetical protein
MPDAIPLTTAAEIVAAAAWVLDRRLDLEHGRVALTIDEQRRALTIAYTALLRMIPSADDDGAPPRTADGRHAGDAALAHVLGRRSAADGVKE